VGTHAVDGGVSDVPQRVDAADEVLSLTEREVVNQQGKF
jgi:hypothetical protein